MFAFTYFLLYNTIFDVRPVSNKQHMPFAFCLLIKISHTACCNFASPRWRMAKSAPAARTCDTSNKQKPIPQHKYKKATPLDSDPSRVSLTHPICHPVSSREQTFVLKAHLLTRVQRNHGVEKVHAASVGCMAFLQLPDAQEEQPPARLTWVEQ